MSPSSATQRVAANVRAEAARQQRSGVNLAKALGWSQAATSRRLSGHVPFDVNELEAIASLLAVPLSDLIGEAVA
jgi:transcriptional regulator with XRE-family HTH domain